MAIYSLALVFVLVALSAAEDMPECAKAGFWKDVSSPACAILYDEEACGGNSTELLVSVIIPILQLQCDYNALFVSLNLVSCKWDCTVRNNPTRVFFVRGL